MNDMLQRRHRKVGGKLETEGGPVRPAWQRRTLVAAIALALQAGAAGAAEPPVAGEGEAAGSAPAAVEPIQEVVVTARKRDERISQAPVAIYALGKKDLEAFAINDIVSASAFTPGLTVSRSTNNGGAQIYLRGVGSSFTSPSFDQAVAINIDNVAISKGRAIYQSYFDMQQMEVLRGPQALFFGKNSTAGVISIRTADPTRKTSFTARAGYENSGKTSVAEFVGSGALSETTGLRVALRGSDMRGGYFKNIGPELNGVARNTATPQEQELGGRVTLVYRPSDSFDLNAKVSLDRLKNDGINAYTQITNCQGPGGMPQAIFGVANVADGCKLDRITTEVALNPALAAHFPNSHGGTPYNEYDGQLGSLTAHWTWEKVDLTAVTGYYRFKSGPSFGNFDLGSSGQVFGNEHIDYRSVTQEFRLASRSDGPFNYAAGLFFDDTTMDFARAVRLFNAPPDPATGRTDQWESTGNTTGNTASAFAELSYEITPALDLSGGVRYSRERKKSVLQTAYASASTGLPFEMLPIRDNFDGANTSPQLTLRWRPDSDTTVFSSYKHGYKSGGSNVGEFPFLGTNAKSLHYESEKVRGGEAGVKGQAGRALSYGVTFYDYTFSDLQVSVFDPVTVTSHVGNAGRYRTRGVELDGAYSVPSIARLKLRGSVYYNDARYTDYIGPCYTGQTIAQGCTLPNGQQDFRGKPGTHAPRLTVSVGANYDVPFTSEGWRLGLAAESRYVSDYQLDETLSPLHKQDAYATLDATLRLYSDNQRWELALIGRNLTDKLAGGNAIDVVGTGSGTGTHSGTPADTYRITGKPREILLLATIRW